MTLGLYDLLWDWIAPASLAFAALGCLYLLFAAILVLRHRVDFTAIRQPAIPVTVLKPLHGAEPDLLRRLMTFCRQDYDGPVQIVFGVQHPHDPAIATVDELRALFPDKDIALTLDVREHGSNRKISNVINMSAEARYPTVILVDSDIEVPTDYLSKIVDALYSPGVGAVTCPYYGTGGSSLASRLSQLAVNAAFLPNVIFAVTLHLARPCFGSTIALRPEVLQQIGGFAAFADCLADDYAIGHAVRVAGHKVVVTPFLLPHACHQTHLSETWAADVRSAQTIKSIDFPGYVGSIITNPLPFTLLAAAGGRLSGLLLMALAVCARVTLCLSVERIFRLKPQPYWLLPLRDLMTFGAYCAGLFGNRVCWRGHKYKVLARGTLIQDVKSVQP